MELEAAVERQYCGVYREQIMIILGKKPIILQEDPALQLLEPV